MKENNVIEMENENVNAEVQQDTVPTVENKKLNRKTIGKIIGGVAAGAVAAIAVAKIVSGFRKKDSCYDEGCVATDADFESSDDYESEE